MFLRKNVLLTAMLLGALALGTLSGCGSQSNEAVKPETFAPPPPGDSAVGEKGNKPSESAEG